MGGQSGHEPPQISSRATILTIVLRAATKIPRAATKEEESHHRGGWISRMLQLFYIFTLLYAYVFYYSKNLAARAANAFIGHYATVNPVNNPPPVEPHLSNPMSAKRISPTLA